MKYITRNEFIAAWERHFGCPIHPLAAALLPVTVQCVELKSYDDEDLLWHLSDQGISFAIGFILTYNDSGTAIWQVQLPSSVFIRKDIPRTSFWIHESAAQKSDKTSNYAKWTQYPCADLFCVMEFTLDNNGGRLAAFFGGELCNLK